MKISTTRVITAGVAGTLVMSLVGLYVAPVMGIPRMNPADMLASQMGGLTILGWMGHLLIGLGFAFAYVTLARTRLPGPAVVRGALFSLVPWLMAQLIVMPMMGMGLFSGSATLAGGSLVGHLMYGAVLGGVVGETTAATSPEQYPSTATAA